MNRFLFAGTPQLKGLNIFGFFWPTKLTSRMKLPNGRFVPNVYQHHFGWSEGREIRNQNFSYNNIVFCGKTIRITLGG